MFLFFYFQTVYFCSQRVFLWTTESYIMLIIPFDHFCFSYHDSSCSCNYWYGFVQAYFIANAICSNGTILQFCFFFSNDRRNSTTLGFLDFHASHQCFLLILLIYEESSAGVSLWATNRYRVFRWSDHLKESLLREKSALKFV